jgi:hypothetical protein
VAIGIAVYFTMQDYSFLDFTVKLIDHTAFYKVGYKIANRYFFIIVGKIEVSQKIHIIGFGCCLACFVSSNENTV